MTDMPAAGSGRAPGRAEPGPIHRDELMATLNRAAQKRVTIISSPAGTGKTSLLRAWADQPGQDGRIAFMTVRPSQHDMQLFWLTMLDAVRAATCCIREMSGDVSRRAEPPACRVNCAKIYLTRKGSSCYIVSCQVDNRIVRVM
jgi:ATP/maltotriose-dependent transcriptional regulator MalT